MKSPDLWRVVERLTLRRHAVDDLDRQVGEVRPFPGPLGFEARRGDDQAPSDAPGPPEDLGGGDRLRCLAQPHVVGQEQAARGQEALDPLELVRIELPLQALDRGLELRGRQHLFQEALQALVLAFQEGMQRRVVPDVGGLGGDDLEQVLDQGQASRRVVGEGPLQDEGAVLPGTEPLQGPRPAVGARTPGHGLAGPGDALQPVAGARQRPDRVPA